jgi:hypothetical protein
MAFMDFNTLRLSQVHHTDGLTDKYVSLRARGRAIGLVLSGYVVSA